MIWLFQLQIELIKIYQMDNTLNSMYFSLSLVGTQERFHRRDDCLFRRCRCPFIDPRDRLFRI